MKLDITFHIDRGVPFTKYINNSSGGNGEVQHRKGMQRISVTCWRYLCLTYSQDIAHHIKRTVCCIPVSVRGERLTRLTSSMTEKGRPGIVLSAATLAVSSPTVRSTRGMTKVSMANDKAQRQSTSSTFTLATVPSCSSRLNRRAVLKLDYFQRGVYRVDQKP